jgi:hypothetical protein
MCKFTANSDGQNIVVGEQSRKKEPGVGRRSWASQLFQHRLQFLILRAVLGGGIDSIR